jgi:hypothetical protein
VFEGFLPEPHNGIVRDMLFILNVFHSSAKLRMHTATTVAFLQETTTALGDVLRTFVRKVCPHYETSELPQEEAARHRRKANQKKKAASGVSAAKKGQSQARSDDGVSDRKGKGKAQPKKFKTLNLCTYKMHAIGDYANSIPWIGTTDNGNTQTVMSLPLLDILKISKSSFRARWSIVVRKASTRSPAGRSLRSRLPNMSIVVGDYVRSPVECRLRSHLAHLVHLLQLLAATRTNRFHIHHRTSIITSQRASDIGKPSLHSWNSTAMILLQL